MRFADGDLPPGEQAAVAVLVAAHPQLARSLEAYRFTRQQLPEIYAPALKVPSELVRRWLPEGGACQKRSWQRLGGRRTAALAIAASVAILLAGGLAWERQGVRPGFAGLAKGIPAPPALQLALEHMRMGERALLAKDVTVEAMSTFASQEKLWCRQYLLTYHMQTQATGLACRTGVGSWRIDVQSAPMPLRAQEATKGAVAGREEEDPVATYRDQILGGTVLTQESEARLITDEHWSRTP
jgi:hypothetical protein